MVPFEIENILAHTQRIRNILHTSQVDQVAQQQANDEMDLIHVDHHNASRNGNQLCSTALAIGDQVPSSCEQTVSVHNKSSKTIHRLRLQ